MVLIPSKQGKAYKNIKFLNSPDARLIRMMAEYLEPNSRFRHYGLSDTIVFFGSSRLRPSGSVHKDINNFNKLSSKVNQNQKKLSELKAELEMARYYDDAVVLARNLTEWSKSLKKDISVLSSVRVAAAE